MAERKQIRLIVLASLLAAFVGFLLSHHTGTPPVHAFSAGPPAGYTGAPGEEPEACAECHVPPDAGTGKISITAPQTYVPGQTYPITVTHTNADPTRLRWGFQLTVLDTLRRESRRTAKHRRSDADLEQRWSGFSATVHRAHCRRNVYRSAKRRELDLQLDCAGHRYWSSHLLRCRQSCEQRRQHFRRLHLQDFCRLSSCFEHTGFCAQRQSCVAQRCAGW